MSYIDKITNKDTGESRVISPAAEAVRVSNENYEGENLDEVLYEVAHAIEDAGSGDGTVTGVKIGSTTYEPTDGVVDLSSPMSNKVDKNGTDSLMTAAEHTKLGNLPTATELATQMNAKANDNAVVKSISVNNGTPQQPINGNVNISIPTKVSDLENDEGYITAEEVAGIVAATGDLTIVESGDYIDILISHPELVVTQLAPMSASTKSGTFKVSGAHLKGDVTISTSATNWTLSVGGGAASQSLTLSPTNGVLAETTITVTYSGSTDSTGNTITVASAGAVSATVTANYTQYSGPTIIPASTSAISIKTGAGSSNTATLSVSGVNLTADITATLGGTDASKFSVSGSPITQANASGTLTITYSPAAGDSGTHSATLTLSSTGADDVTISLGGEVSTITTSESALTMSCQKNSSTTATFTVEGSNLSGNLTIEASGTGLSVDTNSITATDETVSSTTITVTFAPTEAGTVNGAIVISDGNISKTVSVTATATGTQVVYNSLGTNGVPIEWELGQLSTTTGAETESTTRWRTADYLPCSTSFYYTRQGGGNCGICFYASDYSFVSAEYIGSAGSKEVTIPTGAVYFRIYCGNKEQEYVCALDSTTGKYMTISNSAGGTVTTYA